MNFISNFFTKFFLKLFMRIKNMVTTNLLYLNDSGGI